MKKTRDNVDYVGCGDVEEMPSHNIYYYFLFIEFSNLASIARINDPLYSLIAIQLLL